MFSGSDPLFTDWNAPVTTSPLVLSSGCTHGTFSGDSIENNWPSRHKDDLSPLHRHLTSGDSLYSLPVLALKDLRQNSTLEGQIPLPPQASQTPLSPLPFTAKALDHTPFEESLGLTRSWDAFRTDVSPVLHASSSSSSTSHDLPPRLPVSILSTNMTFVDMLQRVRGPSHSSEELEVSMTVNHSSIPALRSPIKTPCRKHSVSTADSGSTIESSSVAVTPKSFSDPSLLSPLTPLTPLTSPQYEDGELSKLSIRFDRKRKPDVLGPLSQLPRMKRLRSSSRTITHQETIASRTRDGPASFNQLKPFRPLPLRCNEPAKLMPSPQPQYTSRNLLQHKGKHIIEISPDFPLFYRRYPASSYFRTTERSSPFSLFQVTNPGGDYNPPRSVFDLYTPRFVKGKGSSKVGLCPICVEPLNRGGEDKKVWLHMKFSAFKCYHMQCAHGISASTGQPFSPPVAFRSVKRHNPGKNERSLLKEGKCHKCSKWVPIEGIKDLESKVKELYWWKHAISCHQGSSYVDKNDIFEKDAVYERLLAQG